MRLVRDYGNPFLIALASLGYGRAFATTDPQRALTAMHQALALTRENRLAYWEAVVVREAAGLEATHGQFDQALVWFDAALASFDRAGNIASLAPALAYVTAFFDRIGRPEVAATIYGSITDPGHKSMAVDLPAVVGNLRAALGDTRFHRYVSVGASMDNTAAVRYARTEIERVRRDTARSDNADAVHASTTPMTSSGGSADDTK